MVRTLASHPSLFYERCCKIQMYVEKVAVGSYSAMSTGHFPPHPESWRTPAAMWLAVAIGGLVGIFLHASAVPFGPILLGWFVTLVGAVLISGILCVLATSRYLRVGFAYAAGVAAASVLSALVAPRSPPPWWGPPLQFIVIFLIVACVSLIGTSLVALLKWEDRKVREKQPE
jgi:FtsH-binding integral membrane protein